MSYTIRRMKRREVDLAVTWAGQEGWNPGLSDASCFWAADPNGFFIGILDGIPVACISAVAYDHEFGFLGFYIVRKEFRGKGYGFKIWGEALKYLAAQNIGLDGVVAQIEKYQSQGFKPAYRNIRYQRIARGDKRSFSGVVQLNTVPFAEIEKYDRRFFPAKRPEFLRCWIMQSQSLALGSRIGGKINGYGVIRKCQTGYKIGPLFANDADAAEKLHISLSSFAKSGEQIFLDVPEVNVQGLALARKFNMTKVFETARMYSRRVPDLPINQIFGVTSFELG